MKRPTRSLRLDRIDSVIPTQEDFLIYAYEETGLIVTQENRRLIPDIELREFDAKVREFYDLFPEHDPTAS